MASLLPLDVALVLWSLVLWLLVVSSNGQSGSGQGPGDDVCFTDNCNSTATEIFSSMNPSADPCTDFYRYACGGWIHRNPLTDGLSYVDRYEKLREENDEFVKTFMKSPRSRTEYASVSAVLKMFQYYDSCMDEHQINHLNSTPLLNLLRQYDLAGLFDHNWDENKWDFQSVLARLVRELGVKSLFEVNVELDATNNSFYFISLQLMGDLVKELGARKFTLSSLLRRVTQFERKLMKSVQPHNSLTSTLMTVQDFGAALADEKVKGKSPIDWLYLLRIIFSSDKSYVIKPDTIIIVNDNNMRYFKKLTKYLAKTSKKTIANYLMWKVIQDLYLKLGKPFWDIHQRYKQKLDKQWQPPDRESTCMEELASLRGFAMPLTRVFVDKKFKGGNKQWVLDAIDRIRNVYIQGMNQINWMDNTTRHQARKKVVANPTTYFDNAISLRKSWNKRYYAKAGKPRNPNEWTMSPVEINAQYEDSYNRMVFPVAILGNPFYDGRFSGAVNFGGIGTVMGHEMIHGFDDAGKDYDSKGRRNDWWTDHTNGEFKRRSGCLVNQYGEYTFPGDSDVQQETVNGMKTLSENIADNGGLKQAFRAYQSWVREFGEEPALPQLGLTNEQLFFVSFAQNWCATYDITKDIDQTSNYSPAPIRVKGSLNNFPEFHKAFNCPQPFRRCSMW